MADEDLKYDGKCVIGVEVKGESVCLTLVPASESQDYECRINATTALQLGAALFKAALSLIEETGDETKH